MSFTFFFWVKQTDQHLTKFEILTNDESLYLSRNLILFLFQVSNEIALYPECIIVMMLNLNWAHKKFKREKTEEHPRSKLHSKMLGNWFFVSSNTFLAFVLRCAWWNRNEANESDCRNVVFLLWTDDDVCMLSLFLHTISFNFVYSLLSFSGWNIWIFFCCCCLKSRGERKYMKIIFNTKFLSGNKAFYRAQLKTKIKFCFLFL